MQGGGHSNKKGDTTQHSFTTHEIHILRAFKECLQRNWSKSTNGFMRATKYSVHIIQRVSIRFGGMIGKWTFKNWLNTSYFEGLVMASDGWKKTSSWGQSRDLDDSQQRETSSLHVSAAQLEANNTDIIHSANLRVRQENWSKLPAIIKGGICFRLLKRNSSTWDTNFYSQEKCHIYLEVLNRTGSVSAYSHPWL